MRHYLLAAILTNFVVVSALSRERGQSSGSAIAPRVSAHSVGASSLRVCLTNGQSASRSSLLTGDAFAFTLGAGSIVNCGVTSAAPLVDGLAAWECEALADGARLTYIGSSTPWPSSHLVCIDLGWLAPGEATTMQVALGSAAGGRIAPPEPAVLVLDGASPDSGFAAARHQAESTGIVRAEAGFGPEAIPGLDVTLTVPPNGQVLAMIEAQPHLGCPSSGSQVSNLVVMLDGVVVTTRRIVGDGVLISDGIWNVQVLHWLSPPLPGGPHRIEAAVEVDEAASSGASPCLGHVTNPDLVTRMITFALPAVN